jgi:hypothetical protein
VINGDKIAATALRVLDSHLSLLSLGNGNVRVAIPNAGLALHVNESISLFGFSL